MKQNTTALIEEWANDKGILKHDYRFKQFTKLNEEVGEVAKELLENDKDKLALEIGDVGVTLVILASQNGLNFDKCLDLAYDKISKRKGKTEGGIFKKTT